MAVITTVHGTYASGPERGSEHWWQSGGPFEDHIRQLVESEDGELHFMPHVWSRANSDAARHDAGEALYQSLVNRPYNYCVIGHSHGGTVIEHALMHAALHGDSLRTLRSWIAIGTPFIESKRRWSLFARVGPMGKAAISFFATLVLVAIASMSADGTLTVSSTAAFLGVISAPALLSWYWHMSNDFWQRRSCKRFCAQEFSSRFLSLRHKSDEAISGLRQLGAFEPALFGRNVAVPALSSLAIFLFPALVMLASMNEGVVQSWAPAEPSAPVAHQTGLMRVVINAGRVYSGASAAMVSAVGEALKRHGYDYRSSDVYVPVNLAIAFAFAALPIVVYFALWLLSKPVSIAIARALNRATWAQMRRLGFGNDLLWGVSVGAGSKPEWMARQPFEPVPDALGDELAAFSDAAAAGTVSKFRAGLSRLALTSRAEEGKVLSDYLTWNELIHNVYFANPRFRKLVGVCDLPGGGFPGERAVQGG